MHEMQAVVIDVRWVSPSVAWLNSASLCGGRLVQPLPESLWLLVSVMKGYR